LSNEFPVPSSETDVLAKAGGHQAGSAVGRQSAGAARRFEDLIAWQKARQLSSAVYTATQSGQLERDLGLRAQMQRAAVSVMANIAEGFERKGAPEFVRYLTIAKSSCAELQSHLYVALDVGYVSDERFAALIGLARETSRVIAGLQTSVARNPELGTRNSVPRARS
jgi:four helix bundle protein